jgi:hypothetical protein
LIAESDDPSFGWALLTPEVRGLTVAGRLAGWRLDGRELFLARHADPALPVDEAAATAQHMVALARALPTDVLAGRSTKT